jgi:hypothetical protein
MQHQDIKENTNHVIFCYLGHIIGRGSYYYGGIHKALETIFIFLGICLYILSSYNLVKILLLYEYIGTPNYL